jgi:hypothetical protein
VCVCVSVSVCVVRSSGRGVFKVYVYGCSPLACFRTSSFRSIIVTYILIFGKLTNYYENMYVNITIIFTARCVSAICKLLSAAVSMNVTALLGYDDALLKLTDPRRYRPLFIFILNAWMFYYLTFNIY